MNGKFLILLFLCLNIASLVGSAACAEAIATCQFGDNVMLRLFISDESINNIGSDPNVHTGVGFSENFTGVASSITNQKSSGTSSFFESGGFNILDGLAMILGFISLLTPFPLLAFIVSADLPILFAVIFGLVPIILYVIAIVEFIRGSQL